MNLSASMFSPVYDRGELSFEIGPIRPPSEAYSLLVRTTRNCPWNRCRFCHTYKGEKFQLRPVEDIKRDIDIAREIREWIEQIAADSGDSLVQTAALVFNNPPNPSFQNVALWLYAGGENVFLQDANSLIMRTADMIEILRHLKMTFPGIKRITSYARSDTAARKKPEELAQLREAGLSRLHIGLESGYDPLLEYVDKGVTADVHVAGGRRVVETGISLSEYVLLGLGGKAMWREHAAATAEALNRIGPDFIRVRTLAINARVPLREEIKKGNFIRQTDEEIVAEERLLLERLECRASFVSDHITNLLAEVEGELPRDKPKMLAVIDSYLTMAPQERRNFRLGRRMGIYQGLNDINQPDKRDDVNRLSQQSGRETADDELIYRLTGRFI